MVETWCVVKVHPTFDTSFCQFLCKELIQLVLDCFVSICALQLTFLQLFILFWHKISKFCIQPNHNLIKTGHSKNYGSQIVACGQCVQMAAPSCMLHTLCLHGGHDCWGFGPGACLTLWYGHQSKTAQCLFHCPSNKILLSLLSATTMSSSSMLPSTVKVGDDSERGNI